MTKHDPDILIHNIQKASQLGLITDVVYTPPRLHDPGVSKISFYLNRPISPEEAKELRMRFQTNFPEVIAASVNYPHVELWCRYRHMFSA